MRSGWRVELERDWLVLGPFPAHAREQHFLSPAYPLDLSLPISTTTQYPTSLTPSAYASWSQSTADPHGTLRISHRSVPWNQMRVTEGWAGLQHMNVLRGWLSVCPPSGTSDLGEDTSEPLLRTELLQGAFFTVLPRPGSPERETCVPEWHHGNIYTLERAPAQLVRLPVSPARNKHGTRYEVIICAPYEIRLFGDPSAYSSPCPILTLSFSVSLQLPLSPPPSREMSRIQHPVEDTPLRHVLTQSITPYIVDGTPFGDAVGIGVQCLDFGVWNGEGHGYWLVVRAHLVPGSPHLPSSLFVALLDEVPVRIAPTQTRVVPLRLSLPSPGRIPEEVKQLDIELTCSRAQTTFVFQITLPLIHVPQWTREKHVPIQASYFFAKSMPTVFSVKPPKEAFSYCRTDLRHHNRVDASKCRGNEPILALHGAGVDILTQSFWADSLPQQRYAWIVVPQGRTAWGLDWHGLSATDAFATVFALSHILSSSSSGRWAKWGFDINTRVILMGHSNGGQGAWYMGSRWPDRICAVVPAAGYIKSQAYVSWSMSRFAHFVDPGLRAVLDNSLTPDDNDLFLGNLVGKPVLALHGGADDNVPPWHTREQVGILKTWDPNADVTYHEDPGQPHWYPDVFSSKLVQAFLDRVYFSSSSPHSARKISCTHEITNQEPKTSHFTLTVAVPTESGSLRGWKICALTTPGLLGRLHVTTDSDGRVLVRTTNVSVASFDLNVWAASCNDTKKPTMLAIDDDDHSAIIANSDGTIWFMRDNSITGLHPKPSWKIHPCTEQLSTTHYFRVPPQRLQSILSTNAPLTLLVPSLASSSELSAALRIAHALQLFHALDAQIVSVSEVENEMVQRTPIGIREGNLVVIGCAESSLVRRWLERAGGLWTYIDGTWCLGATRFERPSSAILFCQPHPYDDQSVALFLQSTDTSGLERAVRLFPLRTGILSPDWLVVDGRADTVGAAGVQGAGVYGWIPSDAQDQHAAGKWIWNERMSWLD